MANKIKLGRATKARLNSIVGSLEANEIVYATDTFEIGVKSGSQLVWFPSATELAKKVDKVSGKGLSTNDYTTTEKTKLSGIESGAQKNVGVEFTQTEKTKLSGIQSGAQKNPTFKTVGGQSIVGTGDIPVSGGGGGANPIFNTYISAYDYDVRTSIFLNQGRGRFIVVVSTSANTAGFRFNGNRISGPNLNTITNQIGYDTGVFIYEVVTMSSGRYFAIKASGQSQYSMYSSFRVDFSSPSGESDYIDMVAWEA